MGLKSEIKNYAKRILMSAADMDRIGYDVCVHILQGTSLLQADWYGKSDPYVKITVSPPQGKSMQYKTQTKWRSVNPEFNEWFEVTNLPRGTAIEFAVWDKDTMSTDDRMGSATWVFEPWSQQDAPGQPCQQAPASGSHRPQGGTGGNRDLALPLEHPTRKGAAAGQLHVRVAYRLSVTEGPPLMKGPVRYKENKSPMVGMFVGKRGQGQVPYSTYKIFLYNVDNYFNGQRCPWNRNYSAAIQIFTNPLAMSTIRTQHASLYSQGSGFWRGLEQSLGTVHRSGGMFVSRTASLLSSFPSSFPSRTVSTSSSSGASQLGSSCVPGGTGGAGGTGGTGGVGGAGGGSGRSKVEGEEPLSSGVELLEMLRYYTYVLMEDSLRFSETGAAFFDDIMSKHAMHAAAAEQVVCAGEFVIVTKHDYLQALANAGQQQQPRRQWWWVQQPSQEELKGQYVLVVDNNSGTYAPPADRLQPMAALLEDSFPGLQVETVDWQNADLLKELHKLCPTRCPHHP